MPRLKDLEHHYGTAFCFVSERGTRTFLIIPNEKAMRESGQVRMVEINEGWIKTCNSDAPEMLDEVTIMELEATPKEEIYVPQKVYVFRYEKQPDPPFVPKFERTYSKNAPRKLVRK